ncbi:hypothetical protein GmRootA79_17640 [Acidovorax sp. A79]|uniref:hypothetical protein n=1 Tax=Acidovorax sp. A79 TaxID=3056107 RepID=UPI0034E88F38
MIKQIFSGIVSASLAACGGVGAQIQSYIADDVIHPALQVNGFCYFDWYKPDNMQKSKHTLEQGGVVQLQARFQWQVPGYNSRPLTEHGILAFTQGEFAGEAAICPFQGNAVQQMLNSPEHPSRQWLFKYGAGLIITPNGLGFELWNGDKTAYAWDQTNNRCMQSTVTGGTSLNCLSNNPTSDSYITEADFTLAQEEYYWVRLTMQGFVVSGRHWTKMRGELIQEKPSGAVVVQHGSVNFLTDSYFPLNAPIFGTMARSSPGSNFYSPTKVKAWMFDGGF